MFRKNRKDYKVSRCSKPSNKKGTEIERPLKPLDILLVDQSGRTLLHQAVTRGTIHEQLVEHMVHSGCDINAPDNTGRRALHLAAEKGLLRWVKILINSGARLDVVDHIGLCPLMIAVCNDRPEVVKYLVENGADVQRQNEHGDTALHYAAGCPTSECIAILLQLGASLNEKNDSGSTPLSVACKVQSLVTAKALLDAGANPNIIDSVGKSPLHYVAECPDASEMAALLIQAGSDVDLVGKDGDAPFVEAIKHNNHRVLKILLDARCDTTNIDGLNATAVALATLTGNLQCVRVLLDHGEDPDEVGYYGMTPVMCACYQSNVPIVDLLFEAGADPNIMSRAGHSALFCAISNQTEVNEEARHVVIKSLLRKNANVNHRMTGAVFHTACTNGRNCLLSFAMASGYKSVVRMLLIAGAEVAMYEVNDWIACTANTGLHYYYEENNVLKPIQDWLSQPPSLKHRSRAVLRKILAPRIQFNIDQLPLPTVLKHYLDFGEFDLIDPERASTVSKDVVHPAPNTVVAACGLAAIDREFGSMNCKS